MSAMSKGHLNTYLVLHGIGSIHENIFLQGVSALDAVDRYFPDDLGLFVRGSLARFGEHEIILKKCVNIDGVLRFNGPRIAVKRLTPRLERTL